MPKVDRPPAPRSPRCRPITGYGGVDNLRELHAFLCDTVLMTRLRVRRPVATPTWGCWASGRRQAGPTILVALHRAQHYYGSTGYVERCAGRSRRRRTPAALCASLRTAEPRLLELGRRRRHGGHRAGAGN